MKRKIASVLACVAISTTFVVTLGGVASADAPNNGHSCSGWAASSFPPGNMGVITPVFAKQGLVDNARVGFANCGANQANNQ
jgi:hypothetical protein